MTSIKDKYTYIVIYFASSKKKNQCNRNKPNHRIVNRLKYRIVVCHDINGTDRLTNSSWYCLITGSRLMSCGSSIIALWKAAASLINFPMCEGAIRETAILAADYQRVPSNYRHDQSCRIVCPKFTGEGEVDASFSPLSATLWNGNNFAPGNCNLDRPLIT